MSENIKIRKAETSKRNVLYAQVSQELYKKVYKTAIETGLKMSDVIRLCVERSIDDVDQQLRKARFGNDKG